jgi:hypothetical protein
VQNRVRTERGFARNAPHPRSAEYARPAKANLYRQHVRKLLLHCTERMKTELSKLAMGIIQCPHVAECLAQRNSKHPCHAVVMSQKASMARFQVPEPWSGELAGASILFLSSNPSIDGKTEYPTRDWDEEKTLDYFFHRFGGGQKEWTKDGCRPLLRDAKGYGNPVQFWNKVMHLACRFLPRSPEPGRDYALVEVVHCKSKGQIGITTAAWKMCAKLYLRDLLEKSHAPVIVCLGNVAKNAVRSLLSDHLVEVEGNIGEMQLVQRKRLVLFLAHPAAHPGSRHPKEPDDAQMARICAWLEKCPQWSGPTNEHVPPRQHCQAS